MAMDKSTCKYCGKEIIWRRTKSGASSPFEPYQVPVMPDVVDGTKWAWIDDGDMIRRVRTCSESYEKEQFWYGYLSHECLRRENK